MRILRNPGEQSRYLERRKAEIGLDQDDFEAARNKGLTRSPGKIALLRALVDQAKADRRRLPFRVFEDFDEPLPDDLLDAFEGRKS